VNGEHKTAFKWLPVFSGYCTGCARCVDACPHNCLGLVWEFATLQHPEDCVSEGDCVNVCRDDAIRMEWVHSTANHDVGRWTDAPDPPPSRPNGWLGGLLDRWSWFRRHPSAS